MAEEKLTIRRATRADLAAIVALLADDLLGKTREVASDALDPAYVRGFEAVARDPNQFLAVADCGGVVVGTLQLTFIPGVAQLGAWRGHIEAVRIASSMRGRGFGAELMGWAIEECRRRGCRLVQLTTNKQRKDAQRFYDRLGFVASHEGYKLALT